MGQINVIKSFSSALTNLPATKEVAMEEFEACKVGSDIRSAQLSAESQKLLDQILSEAA